MQRKQTLPALLQKEPVTFYITTNGVQWQCKIHENKKEYQRWLAEEGMKAEMMSQSRPPVVTTAAGSSSASSTMTMASNSPTSPTPTDTTATGSAASPSISMTTSSASDSTKRQVQVVRSLLDPLPAGVKTLPPPSKGAKSSHLPTGLPEGEVNRSLLDPLPAKETNRPVCSKHTIPSASPTNTPKGQAVCSSLDQSPAQITPKQPRRQLADRLAKYTADCLKRLRPELRAK